MACCFALNGYLTRRGIPVFLILSSIQSATAVGSARSLETPIAFKLKNPSFEGSLAANEWILHHSRVVDGTEANVNLPKNGNKWLLLPPSSRAGQYLGKWNDLFGRSHWMKGDRFFVSFALSSLQNSDSDTSIPKSFAPHVNPKVALWLSSGTESWDGGQEMANKSFSDRTNHIRGDFNSYIDGSAVLSIKEEVINPLVNCWLVFTNTVDLEIQHNSRSTIIDHSSTIDDVSLFVSNSPPHDFREDRPNLLIVLQDDLGYGDVSSFNEASLIFTPNIDRVAMQGMRFTDAHSGATICGPSRVALLTGTLPSKLGVHGNFVTRRATLGPPTLPAGTATIATMCRAQVRCFFRLLNLCFLSTLYLILIARP
jgi:hypothetical protein